MSNFQALFGIRADRIQKNCILLPLLKKDFLERLKVKKISRGRLFGAASTESFSVVVCGVGAALAGDAVLYLKETPCQNVILFGSCGLVAESQGLSIGSLVAPAKSYAYESFSQLLLQRNKAARVFYPDKTLFQELLQVGESQGLKKAVCATVSSLKLEEKMQSTFKKNKIDVVDMECSAFFSACGFCGIKGAAIFYTSDIIKRKPFYISLDSLSRTKINLAIEKGIKILRTLIK